MFNKLVKPIPFSFFFFQTKVWFLFESPQVIFVKPSLS